MTRAAADTGGGSLKDVEALQQGLAGLPTDRLARLAAAIGDPKRKIIAGIWHPGCPMVLAGYAPDPWAPAQSAELVFCRAWDEFVEPARRPLGLGRLPRVASRDEVSRLLGLTRAELARRGAVPDHAAGRPEAERTGRWHRPSGAGGDRPRAQLAGRA